MKDQLTIHVSQKNLFIYQDKYSYQDLKALSELIYKSTWERNNTKKLTTKIYIISTDIYFAQTENVLFGKLKLNDAICPFEYKEYMKAHQRKIGDIKLKNILLEVTNSGQFRKKDEYTHDELIIQLELMYRAIVRLQTGKTPTVEQCNEKVAASFIIDSTTMTTPIQRRYPQWFRERKKYLDTQTKGGVGI